MDTPQFVRKIEYGRLSNDYKLFPNIDWDDLRPDQRAAQVVATALSRSVQAGPARGITKQLAKQLFEELIDSFKMLGKNSKWGKEHRNSFLFKHSLLPQPGGVLKYVGKTNRRKLFATLPYTRAQTFMRNAALSLARGVVTLTKRQLQARQEDRGEQPIQQVIDEKDSEFVKVMKRYHNEKFRLAFPEVPKEEYMKEFLNLGKPEKHVMDRENEARSSAAGMGLAPRVSLATEISMLDEVGRYAKTLLAEREEALRLLVRPVTHYWNRARDKKNRKTIEALMKIMSQVADYARHEAEAQEAAARNRNMYASQGNDNRRARQDVEVIFLDELFWDFLGDELDIYDHVNAEYMTHSGNLLVYAGPDTPERRRILRRIPRENIVWDGDVEYQEYLARMRNRLQHALNGNGKNRGKPNGNGKNHGKPKGRGPNKQPVPLALSNRPGWVMSPEELKAGVCVRCREIHTDDQCVHHETVCHNCGVAGHIRRACPQVQAVNPRQKLDRMGKKARAAAGKARENQLVEANRALAGQLAAAPAQAAAAPAPAVVAQQIAPPPAPQPAPQQSTTKIEVTKVNPKNVPMPGKPIIITWPTKTKDYSDLISLETIQPIHKTYLENEAKGPLPLLKQDGKMWRGLIGKVCGLSMDAAAKVVNEEDNRKRLVSFYESRLTQVKMCADILRKHDCLRSFSALMNNTYGLKKMATQGTQTVDNVSGLELARPLFLSCARREMKPPSWVERNLEKMSNDAKFSDHNGMFDDCFNAAMDRCVNSKKYLKPYTKTEFIEKLELLTSGTTMLNFVNQNLVEQDLWDMYQFCFASMDEMMVWLSMAGRQTRDRHLKFEMSIPALVPSKSEVSDSFKAVYGEVVGCKDQNVSTMDAISRMCQPVIVDASVISLGHIQEKLDQLYGIKPGQRAGIVSKLMALPISDNYAIRRQHFELAARNEHRHEVYLDRETSYFIWKYTAEFSEEGETSEDVRGCLSKIEKVRGVGHHCLWKLEVAEVKPYDTGATTIEQWLSLKDLTTDQEPNKFREHSRGELDYHLFYETLRIPPDLRSFNTSVATMIARASADCSINSASGQNLKNADLIAPYVAHVVSKFKGRTMPENVPPRT